MVSRHHARLYWGGDQYYLEDLGSANGVFYQEQRVSRHPLKHGDAARCGSLWLRFVDPQPAYGQQPVAAQQQPPQVMPQTPQVMYRPPSQQIPVLQPTGQSGPVHGTPPGPSLADAARAEADAEEIRRLGRRIEQLQTELRIYRGGKGAEVAKKIEELENDNSGLEREVSQLKMRIKELEGTLAAESSDLKVQKAGALAVKTAEAVQAMNDILSNLRINVMAAEGEFEQFSLQIPRASFELIREALRSSSSDVDTARELLRALRELASN